MRISDWSSDVCSSSLSSHRPTPAAKRGSLTSVLSTLNGRFSPPHHRTDLVRTNTTSTKTLIKSYIRYNTQDKRGSFVHCATLKLLRTVPLISNRRVRTMLATYRPHLAARDAPGIPPLPHPACQTANTE